MTSVDDLFKKPSLPSGSFKRKFEAPDAQQAYKAAKLTNGSSPNGNGASGDDAADEDDVEAGPELPPDEEEDDEEGRFFGGGVTKDAAEALDYLDQQDEGSFSDEKIDSAWLRRLTVSFERKVGKNAELRAKYETEPQKFMQSEADLDSEIKSWSLLSEHTELYAEFARSGVVTSLVNLLTHENTDIAIGTIEIISELLDDDAGADTEDWDALVTSLLDADLVELLMSNLTRLDEENESDRNGVYHTLAVMENLGGQQAIAQKVGQQKVLLWLCNRIAKPERPLGQNKQYAAEVLQVLLQSSSTLRQRIVLDLELDGVDLFLQSLSAYRKRDPTKDSHEEEYAENLFDALTCVVDEPQGKVKFVEAEGVELCLIMLQEGGMSKGRALRLLDHAAAGHGLEAASVGEKIVDAAGLKVIFSIFMKKADNTSMEHLLGLFSSLLRLLPGQSAARIRTLAKFTERKLEKIAKLITLRSEYVQKVAAVDKQFNLERSTLDEAELDERSDEFFSRRLDGGLFCQQTIDTILAWLIAEEPAARSRILDALEVNDIRISLQSQLDELGEQVLPLPLNQPKPNADQLLCLSGEPDVLFVAPDQISPLEIEAPAKDLFHNFNRPPSVQFRMQAWRFTPASRPRILPQSPLRRQRGRTFSVGALRLLEPLFSVGARFDTGFFSQLVSDVSLSPVASLVREFDELASSALLDAERSWRNLAAVLWTPEAQELSSRAENARVIPLQSFGRVQCLDLKDIYILSHSRLHPFPPSLRVDTLVFSVLSIANGVETSLQEHRHSNSDSARNRFLNNPAHDTALDDAIT
nr:beta-catenin-like protein 1 like [Quercus suber]